MSTASGSSEKGGYLLVQITDGSPPPHRYTDNQIDTDGYTSTPAMEVELPVNQGSFDGGNSELRITLPVDDFTGTVSSGLPHSPMFVTVEEVTSGMFIGDAGARKILFRGRVLRTIKNHQGRNNAVAFFCKNIKSRLDVPMGISCMHHCQNTLFKPACGLTQSTYQVLGQIASMDGKEVTISTNPSLESPTAPGGRNDRFWERGYLEKDGCRIGVHIWTIADPTVFVLRRRPPNSWLLAGASSILFVPGCHKTIEDCREVWDNEEGQLGSGGFNGPGYSMLPYNPLFQNPQ